MFKSFYVNQGARHFEYPPHGYTRVRLPFDLAYQAELWVRDTTAAPVEPLHGGKPLTAEFLTVQFIPRFKSEAAHLAGRELGKGVEAHSTNLCGLTIGNTLFISTEMISLYADATGLDAEALTSHLRSRNVRVMPRKDFPATESRFNRLSSYPINEIHTTAATR